MREIENDHQWDGCPACGRNQARQLGPIDYGTAVTFGSTPIGLRRQPELWSCAACSTWFTRNALRPADAMGLYRAGSSGERWQAEAFHVSKPAEMVRAVNAILRPAARVVDVGCNTGELLDHCRARGATTFGVEPSAASSAICAAKGHVVLPSLRDGGGAMDVVFAFDLVEHLYDLRAFVDLAAQALRPGGHLVVLTGDNESPTAVRFRNRWWYVRYPEHVVFASFSFWSAHGAFRPVERIGTYASKGYRCAPVDRLKGLLKLGMRRGNGLPLVSGDHHLLILQKR